MTDRSVVVRLRGDVSDFVATMGRAGQTVKSLKAELATATETEKGRRNLDQVGTAAMAMGAGLLAGFGVAAASAAQFDKAMSEVKSVSGATGQQLGTLRQAALDAGRDTAFSATEAAKAEAELAKAGMSVSNILNGGLKGALSLAAAGQMDLADAATITAKTLNMFQLDGAKAGHVADVLASAANTSAADMHDLGMGLNQVGLVAHDAGFSLEETTGILAAFADRGLEGSDGATSLKTAIQMLQAPTDKAAGMMRELGINVFDSHGKMLGAADIAGQLQKAFGGLSDAERTAAMTTIFGADAVRAGTVLYGLGSDGVRKYTSAVDQQGAAADTAAAKTDNLAGDVERLKGSLETLTIETGSGASGGLRKLAQMADGMVQSFGALPAPVSEAVTVVAGLAGAALLVGGGMLKARTHIAEVLGSLREMGPTSAKAADGLDKATKVAAKLAIGLAAVNTAATLMGSDVSVRMGKFNKDLVEFGKNGKVGSEAAAMFGQDLGQLKYDLSTLDTAALAKIGTGVAGFIEGLTSTGTVFDESLTHAKERISKLDEALSGMVQSGHADDAKSAFDRIAAAAKSQGVSVDELMRGLPGYAAALDGATQTQTNAITATERQNNALSIMNGTLNAAIDITGSFKDAWDRLHGSLLGSLDANIAAEQAIDDLGAALGKNGVSWDLNTQAGRDNSKALSGVIKDARDAAQAKYDENHSVEEATATYDVYKQKLYETLTQAGMTEAAAHALVDQWLKMPPLASTKVDAPGIDATIEKVISLQRGLNGLKDRSVTITTYQNTVTGEISRSVHAGPRFERWGGITEHAQVGLLREAQVYSAVSSGARYAFAEPATRGEAFIPRAGNHDRAMGILQHAASWYGASVVPDGTATLRRAASYGAAPVSRGSGGGGGGSSPDALAQALARELAPMMAQLANRPSVIKANGRELARTVREAERDLGYQG